MKLWAWKRITIFDSSFLFIKSVFQEKLSLCALGFSVFLLQNVGRREKMFRNVSVRFAPSSPKASMWVWTFSWEVVPGGSVSGPGSVLLQLLKGATGNRGSVHLETLQGKCGRCSDLPTEGCGCRNWGIYPSFYKWFFFNIHQLLSHWLRHRKL